MRKLSLHKMYLLVAMGITSACAVEAADGSELPLDDDERSESTDVGGASAALAVAADAGGRFEPPRVRDDLIELDLKRDRARLLQVPSCKQAPDLVVDTLDYDQLDWDHPNRRSLIHVTVRNVGRGSAPATVTKLVATRGDVYELATPALAGGASTVLVFTTPYWVSDPNVYLDITADAKKAVFECLAGEQNNLTSIFLLG